MIHWRRTHPMAPGRQAQAVEMVKEWASIFKEQTGVDVRISVVITGTLGVACMSADCESIGAWEAARAKASDSSQMMAFGKKHAPEMQDTWVWNTEREEIWRYS